MQQTESPGRSATGGLEGQVYDDMHHIKSAICKMNFLYKLALHFVVVVREGVWLVCSFIQFICTRLWHQLYDFVIMGHAASYYGVLAFWKRSWGQNSDTTVSGLEEHWLWGVKCLMLPYVTYKWFMMHHSHYVSLRLKSVMWNHSF